MPTVQVVFDALDAEAKKWNDLKPVMADAATAADDIVLTHLAFFAGTDIVSPVVLTGVHNDLKDKVHTLCGQAVTEYGQLHDAMIRAKELYRQTDGDAARNVSVPVFGH